MKIKVKFFAYFRELFGGREREFELKQGFTIKELLKLLCDSSERRDEVFDGEKLKPYLIIMKNGISIQSLNQLETKIGNGDVISIFPLMGGG